jgi:signal transduction histidine kinase
MTPKALQILLVEDNAGDARLIREMFSNEKPDGFQLTHLLCMRDAEIHLATGGVDIVLLDMGLPDEHGLDTVRRTHAAAPDIPMIVLTGLDDEALASEAMKEGAQDYLIKGQIENRALPRALRHAIERHRMQTEADLVRTHQLQFKDEFLSHVSHELRSPLTAIHQFVTILLDGIAGELSPEQHQYLEIVLRNAKQLHAMINDLFEISGAQAGKLHVDLQCTSLADAVAYAVSSLQGAATAKDVALSSDIASGLPSICADAARLRQILVILVDNAIKFTPAKGAVKVQARASREDPNLAVVEVSDSGCGIAAGMNERIFERLFQASDATVAGRKGLGLGLYIAKDLVTRQGGKIWAENAPEQGSVFSVTFPIFSLANLIAPAFKREHGASPITLVVTETGSKTGWLSREVRAARSREVRAFLQECLHSDLDVLLPNMGSTVASELFFMVAITGAVGGEAITKRIRERFDDCAHLRQAGLTLSTSYQSLQDLQRTPGEPVEHFLIKVAANTQKLVDKEISSRVVTNG